VASLGLFPPQSVSTKCMWKRGLEGGLEGGLAALNHPLLQSEIWTWGENIGLEMSIGASRCSSSGAFYCRSSLTAI